MLWLFQAGALWGYASVFSASFAANIPIPGIHDSTTCNVDSDFDGCSQLYRIYVGIFALIVLPLSCTELKEQRALQVAYALYQAPSRSQAYQSGVTLCVCVLFL